jgi:hypothetical protein
MEIARFEKSSYEEVRVDISEWKTQKYLNLRVWINPRYEQDGEPKPTKKGITLNIELLPKLIEALKKAEKEVMKDD